VGYTNAYKRIAELEIEAHKASIEEIKSDTRIPETDKPNTISATERNITNLENFLQEVSDESKMEELMRLDKRRIENGDGVLPEGKAGGLFGSGNKILQGRRITEVENLNAFLDEERI